MKRYLLYIVVIFSISGCSTTRTVRIISDPPGAKIEINNNYVGTTPLSTNLVRYVDPNYFRACGTFSIKAYPGAQGQFVQTKFIGYSDSMPQTIYFNMNVDTVMPTIRTDENIRIRNE